MTVKELLQKCVDRDRDAWDEFVRRYRSVVARSVQYKLKNMNASMKRGEYLDIVQEIFLLIWEKGRLSKVKNANCIRGWLAIVSMNVTSNYCRKQILESGGRLFSLDGNPLLEEQGAIMRDVLPSGRLDTKKMLESGELKSAIDREIAKLGTKQRLALKFNIYDGKSQKDIAEIMNIPGGTVATLIKRAKERLRHRLRDIRKII
ncbi:MAG: RNA polymerase sigma factor [Candidatus Omnitrophota bacterium]|nr:RNA polymerase sigma factor [Candidatus Omnitrophota bacterium]